MTRLRVVLALLVIITAMAVSTNYGLYYRLSYILALVLLLSYLWTWTNGRWIKVSVNRDVTATRVGGLLEERLTVSNHFRFLPAAWVEVEEASDMPDHGGEMVISLPKESVGRWAFRTRCRRRGKFHLGPVSVISSDPLGLFRKGRSFGKPEPFLVYPSVLPLPNLHVSASDLPGDAASRFHSQAVTPNAAGVRDYAPGDSYSRVHWKTTARVGRLMVKEFEQEESTKLWVVMDMQESVHAGREEESTEEYGVTAAASIVDKYLKAGLPVGLLSYGDIELALPPKSGLNQYDLIMEGLAEVRARSLLSLSEVLSAHEQRFNRYCTLVIITPSTDETWLGVLRRLNQKRVQASVVLLEAQTFGAVDSVLPMVSSLAASQLPNCLVRKGDDLKTVLDFGYAIKAV